MQNVINVWMSPIVGALSDSLGRKPMMLYGRVGWLLIWVILPHVKTLRQWLIVEIFFTGFLRAGDNASQQAACALQLAPFIGVHSLLLCSCTARHDVKLSPVLSGEW